MFTDTGSGIGVDSDGSMSCGQPLLVPAYLVVLKKANAGSVVQDV